MKPDKILNAISALIILIVLTSCGQAVSTPASPDPMNVPTPTTDREPETANAQVRAYSLGDSTILQDQFPEDSRFRHMPVRLEGVIGVPGSEGPHPTVLILHGSHTVCIGEDVWPCSPEAEQQNYAGFTYLVEALANSGYVALSINVNAEHTFAYGESPITVRSIQLINAHLAELIAANAGESDQFGLNLTGRVDISRMVWMGHSRGGDLINWIVRQQNLAAEASPIGFGPVQGLILMAPSVFSSEALPAVNLPMAVILPTCDDDVVNLDGQLYYESARFDPTRTQPITSVFLEGGSHKNFNTILEPDDMLKDRPDCAEGMALAPEAQRDFMVQYTLDFLRWLFPDANEGKDLTQKLGLDAGLSPPTSFYNYPVQVNTLFKPAQHLNVILPQSEAETGKNLLGGEVEMSGITTVFCPQGYYVPAMVPGTEACKRVNFNQPGYPQQFVINWESLDAQWQTSLPEISSDLSSYTSLQLRAALDPLSDLNPLDETQSFSIVLTDAGGSQAQVAVSDLPYPPGKRQPNEYFEGEFFNGHVIMNTFIIPLIDFSGIDLTGITEIALHFDQRETGSLFISDLALLH